MKTSIEQDFIDQKSHRIYMEDMFLGHRRIFFVFFVFASQWGAAITEIKVPSVENTAYSHTSYAYCQEFLP